MSKIQIYQEGIDVDSFDDSALLQISTTIYLFDWHCKRLLELAEEAGVPYTTCARDLLYAAIEQASDNPPPRTQPVHLQKFDEGAK